MKRLVVFLITFSMVMTMGFSFTAIADSQAGWHLKDIAFEDGSRTYEGKVMGTVAGQGLLDEVSYTGEKNNITISHIRYDYNPGTKVKKSILVGQVTNLKWTEPQSFLKADEQLSISVESTLVETLGSKAWTTLHRFYFGGSTYGELKNSAGSNILANHGKDTFTSKKWPKGKVGDTITCQVHLGDGFKYSYTYEWKEEMVPPTPAPAPTPAPTTPVLTGGNNAESFASGARIMWYPTTGLGYRLFRSTSPSELGISVTDFYITSTSYADVNVEAKTTYYYTVKPVLAEARPYEGIEEKLGPSIATFTVTTGSEIYKPGLFKHFIMLKLESPTMSVDGVSQEVDPGRGTTPLVLAGRTMVPIRAVVEAMGGTVGWDGPTQKITLMARGNTVEMWLGKKDIKINGKSQAMDIAPISKNGRTFVPVRFAAENLNCKVDWINSTKEAIIVYEE